MNNIINLLSHVNNNYFKKDKCFSSKIIAQGKNKEAPNNKNIIFINQTRA